MNNKRSTLIVDKSFQYNQIIPVVTIAILAANAVLISVFLLLGTDSSNRLQTFIWVVAVIEVVLVVAAIYYSAITSNRIAGPVYRLKKVLREIADGDLTVRIKLRKRDYLQDLAQEINDATALLETRIQAIQVVATSLRGEAAVEGGADSSLSELDRLLKPFKVRNSGQ